jgi:hypothetical protein
MITGIDRTFSIPAGTVNSVAVLLACMRHWPDAIYQNAEEAELLPIHRAILSRPGSLGSEFFIYRDRQCAESWGNEGATPENQDSMIHILISGPQLTLVIGTRTAELEAIEHDILEFLQEPREVG